MLCPSFQTKSSTVPCWVSLVKLITDEFSRDQKTSDWWVTQNTERVSVEGFITPNIDRTGFLLQYTSSWQDEPPEI